jgi:hypothetical protein
MIYRFGAKMSKSKGNVVAPDELLERYGADALRVYILFMGPADQDKEWQETGSRAPGGSCSACGGRREQLERPDSRRDDRHAARAQGAPDDREGERRHRAAVRLQHARRRR